MSKGCRIMASDAASLGDAHDIALNAAALVTSLTS
jgi:hypothetical protein